MSEGGHSGAAAPPEIVPGAFMGVQAPLDKARFLVLPLPFEKTTSYKKGTGQGPAALIEGSMGVELWDEELDAQTHRSGIHTLKPLSGGSAEELFPRIGRRVSELLCLEDKTLFSVGGEHSLSQAVIPSFVKRFPGLSVLHFDAHADMRPSYEGSPHNHACAMYPISKLCKLVQFGIRSISEDEYPLLNKGNVRTFPIHAHRDPKTLLPKLLKELSDTVYISIDLDGFDPAVVPGVGTPQPGGFSWFEGLELFRGVIAKKNVVGVDIMELCPLKDTVNSELAAAKLMYRLMGYLNDKDLRTPRLPRASARGKRRAR